MACIVGWTVRLDGEVFDVVVNGVQQHHRCRFLASTFSEVVGAVPL